MTKYQKTLKNNNTNNNNNNNKNNKKTKKLDYCAPNIKSNGISCFDRSAINRLVKIWNKKHDINLNIKIGKKTTNKLWKELNNKMKGEYKCKDGDESCWVKQSFIKNNYDRELTEELSNYLKPIMPESWNSEPNKWLNTINIEDVLEQYEDKHSDFLFVGAVPIDFDEKIGMGQCVSNELCNINLKKLYKKGIRKIGVVFNLDKHNQSGSHWIALYCKLNKNKGEVNYWDSYGISPPPEVTRLMNNLKNQASKMNINLKKNINKVRHQYKNTECGIYSIYFIVSQLEGKTFKDVSENIVKDEEIFKKRKEFFITN